RRGCRLWGFNPPTAEANRARRGRPAGGRRRPPPMNPVSGEQSEGKAVRPGEGGGAIEPGGSTPPDRRTLSFGSSATPLPMGPEDRLHFRRVQGSLMANLVAGAGQATHDAFCCYCGARSL